jgi:predicted alpha/beta-hydrolase family hydrolase
MTIKHVLTCLAIAVSSMSVTAQMSGYEVYNTDKKMIDSSVDRSTYFTSYSFFGGTVSKDTFLKTADRSKGVVIYAHGCSRKSSWDRDIRKFYLELGFNLVDTDFLRRTDGGPSCGFAGNQFVYKANVYERLRTRELELSAHIKFLKDNGFDKIIAVGHSEGGMVIQMLSAEVHAAIIHSMMCVPTHQQPNPSNKTLRLFSVNDPLVMPRWGVVMLCEDHHWYKNFTNVLTNVESHAPLADDNWKTVIKNFLI